MSTAFRNYTFGSPLCIAAKEGNINIIRLLISKGANINPKSVYNVTVLDYAKQDTIKNLLRSHGAKTGKELRKAQEKK